MQDITKVAVDRRDGDFIQSLERGLAVIRAFDRHHAQMTLSEVARRAGLPRAAARRLLLTLVTLGYARTDGKLFELTPRVLDLGYAYLSTLGVAEVAQLYMEEVSRELGENCAMAVLDRAEIIYVARVPAGRIMDQVLSVGTRLPAYSTALGQVLLAAMADADILALMEAYPLAQMTSKSIMDPGAYMTKIEEIRRLGYALVDEELEPGVRSIAVPIHDRRNRVIAAMNVGAHAGRMSLADMTEKVLPVLRRAAHDTERPIGHI